MASASLPDKDYAATIPLQTFMVYQLMFAIITPALITGAFAERVKFSAMLVFMILWALFVYSPMAHMVWGKGGLLNASLGGRFPTLDFAGGTVVHVTSGVSALVTALYLGKRIGYPKVAMPPHSVVLSFVGAALLWVGWFGFNAGSALGSGTLATSAFVATHFGAAAAACGWSAAEWLRNGKPSALGAISGAVAGLVGITPAAGFVTPISALVDRPHHRRLLLLHGRYGQSDASATTTRSMPSASTGRAAPSAPSSLASLPPRPSTQSSAQARRPASLRATRTSCSTSSPASPSPGPCPSVGTLDHPRSGRQNHRSARVRRRRDRGPGHLPARRRRLRLRSIAILLGCHPVGHL